MFDKYPLLMRIFHWVSAILILALLGMGIWMTGLQKDYPDRMFYYQMHKSFGIIALILVIMRILNRAISTAPELPYQIKKFDENLAHLAHFTIYLLLLLQPLSGYFMSALGGYPVFFFSWELPSLFDKNKELATQFWLMHKYCGYALIGVITLHVLGPIKHLMVERVNIFSRMW